VSVGNLKIRNSHLGRKKDGLVKSPLCLLSYLASSIPPCPSLGVPRINNGHTRPSSPPLGATAHNTEIDRRAWRSGPATPRCARTWRELEGTSLRERHRHDSSRAEQSRAAAVVARGTAAWEAAAAGCRQLRVLPASGSLVAVYGFEGHFPNASKKSSLGSWVLEWCGGGGSYRGFSGQG